MGGIEGAACLESYFQGGDLWSAAEGETGERTMSRQIVQAAQPGGMSAGRSIRDARPAKVSVCGVIWSSPVPANKEEAEFFNRAAVELAKLEGAR